MRTRKGGVLVNINEIERKEKEAEIEAAREIIRSEAIARRKRKQDAITAGIPPEPDPVYSEEEEEEKTETFTQQINRILSYCTLEYIQRGSYGFVFKLTYHGELHSGFIDVETQKEARVFVLKVQAIDFEMVVDQAKEELSKLDRETSRITWEKLKKEVTLQKTLFETALKAKIRPPCPPILDYRGITLADLVSLLEKVPPKPEDLANPKKITFEDNRVRENNVIDPSKYREYNAGVILMEFIPAIDIVMYHTKHKVDPYKDQEIKNKAFRAYCTALTLGIDQGDAKHSNFLFDENGIITMIDFGEANYVRDKPKLDKLITDAEKTGQYSELITKLKFMHPMLKDWLFNPYDAKLYPSLLIKFEPLKPIPIDAGIATKCESGICHFRPPTEKIRPPDPVKRALTPYEIRVKELTDRRDAEVERRIQDKEAELKQKVEDEKAESEQKAADEKVKLATPKRWGLWGGKRTKNKRVRKRRTRRK
jgi:serine/threonine protein kinase